MTFPLQKPGGWVDNIDTITGQQIGNIDVNLHRALDDSGGGAYNPGPGPIIIGGVGGLDIQNGVSTTMTGPVTLQGASAHILYRVDRTTIAPTAIPTTFTIDSSSDIFITSGPCFNVCDVGINVAQVGYEAAAEGQRIIIRKFADPVNDTLIITLHQDTPVGAQIATLPALNTLAAPQVNPFVQIELVFNGTSSLWEVVRCHPQCTL